MSSSQDPLLFATIQAQDDVEPAPNPLYDIQPTAYGGRGAFARSFIPKGNLVLSCSGPYASVIFKSFKREVCAWCFAYAFESGKRKWSVKLDEVDSNGAGAWFCSESCRETWITDYQVGDGGIGWWLDINSALEKSVAQMGKRVNAAPSTSRFAFLDNLTGEKVTKEFIDQAWNLVHEVSFQESKEGARSEWTEELNEIEQDTVRFVLDGLMRKVIDDSKSKSTHQDLDVPQTQLGIGLWPDFFGLQDNELALLQSKPYLIESQLLSYRFLRHSVMASQYRSGSPGGKSKADLTTPDVNRSIHPIERLRRLLSTPTLARAIFGRDYGNVFGIWDTAPNDQGSEMLGWGAYVFASCFNHGTFIVHLSETCKHSIIRICFCLDCSPNLKKRSDKRGIAFYTLRDVHPGEELCIAYIDETVSVNERLESLQRDWFFTCRCTKCLREMEASTAFNASFGTMVHEGKK